MIRLFELVAWVAALLPLAPKVALARLAGFLVFAASRRIRRNTISNMSTVLELPQDHPKVVALARESVMQYAEHVVDLLAYHRDSTERLRARTRGIEGWEHVLAGLAPGRGTLFVTAHFGNFEVGGAILARQFPITIIQETFANPEANELLRRIRVAKNLHAVQLGRAAGPVMRTLRRNGIVGLLADRPTPGKGVEVRFFGRPTHVPDGAARLAFRTGSSVVVGGFIRNRDHTYCGVASPPIFPNQQNDLEQEVARITQAMMSDIETLIRRSPHQWYMFRSMWPGTDLQRDGTAPAIGTAA